MIDNSKIARGTLTTQTGTIRNNTIDVRLSSQFGSRIIVEYRFLHGQISVWKNLPKIMAYYEILK